ncbi:hypothetical protein SAMN02745206_00139 [Desulfacinum infernum DSM 9756]|uniref:Uncharacterized protein n=1 Tax=Desulfacinum infernum DSM 9756 TaxID=1121391 RepID=A0A1M4SMR7_9BACT|nr:hypothetical protein SAMN02745206_00139 [Desulfacinum infernum DSM 9756]
MSSSYLEKPRHLRLDEELPRDGWPARPLKTPSPADGDAYLDFLEDIGAFSKSKGAAKVFDDVFRLPGCDEDTPDPQESEG